MASKLVSDLLLCNVPHANDLVLRSSCKIPAIRAEANTADVKVSFAVIAIVLEVADLLASVDVKDLCGSVASGGHKPSVVAEPNTADNTLMRKVMDEIHVQSSVYLWVKDGVPVLALTLQVWWELVRFIL